MELWDMYSLWLITGLISMCGCSSFDHEIGCYIDQSSRAMSGYSEFINNLTPDLCIQKCREKQFAYAGVQNANECHCGQTYGTYGRANTSECNQPCSGNAKQLCGGDRRNHVFTVCPAGKYGANCFYDCPLLCQKVTNEYCDHLTGECIYGCNKGYSHCNGTTVDCYKLKGDPRPQLNELNTKSGRWFNFFPTIRFERPGRISQIGYYAIMEGNFFVSFWRQIPETTDYWSMVGKVKIYSWGPGRNSSFVDTNIYVDVGDALAIHYEQSMETNGIIYYEVSTNAYSSGISEHHLKPVINLDIRDDGWKTWKTMEIAETLISNIKKLPALEISIDCLQKTCPDHTYGPGCNYTCLSNCVDSVCSPINGECLEGCTEGWMGSHCNRKCPGYCAGSEGCDRFTGLCLQGCSPGYQGAQCNMPCSLNTFGQNCAGVCHCVNSSMCHHVSGQCMGSDDQCMDGWVGCKCSIPISDHHDLMIAVGAVLLTLLLISLITNIYLLKLWCPFKCSKNQEHYTDNYNTKIVQYEPFQGDEVRLADK